VSFPVSWRGWICFIIFK